MCSGQLCFQSETWTLMPKIGLISGIYEMKDYLLKGLMLVHINTNNFESLNVYVQSKAKVILFKLNKKISSVLKKSWCKINF